MKTLVQRLESIGWRAVAVPYARRAEAIREVAARHGRGELDEAFYQEYLAPLVAEPPLETPDPRSLILVAVPDRPVQIRFTLDGVPFAALASPGYLRKPRGRLPGLVREILEPAGFSVARADGPMKTIAAVSGLCPLRPQQSHLHRRLGELLPPRDSRLGRSLRGLAPLRAGAARPLRKLPGAEARGRILT